MKQIIFIFSVIILVSCGDSSSPYAPFTGERYNDTSGAIVINSIGNYYYEMITNDVLITGSAIGNNTFTFNNDDRVNMLIQKTDAISYMYTVDILYIYHLTNYSDTNINRKYYNNNEVNKIDNLRF